MDGLTRPCAPPGPTIGIVGCGAVGASVLVALLARARSSRNGPGRIVVVDRDVVPGRGLAYQDDRDSNLLNRTAAAISVDPADLEAFHKWLLGKAQDGTLPGRYGGVALDRDAYLPRSLFGLYVEETVAATIADLRKLGWQVDRVVDEVVRVERQVGAWCLHLARGGGMKLDAVVLCTGNAPATNYPGLEGCPGYHASPYPVARLVERIGPGARVAVLGSRLSAVDAALAISQECPGSTLAFASRSGLLPMVGAGRGGHRLSPPTLAAAERGRRLGPGSVSLRQVMRLLLTEMGGAAGRRVTVREVTGPAGCPVRAFLRNVEEAKTGSRAWQEALIPLNDHVADLWSGLSKADRARLTKGAYGRYMAHRVAIPLENGLRIAELLRSGRLRVLSGLRGVSHRAAEFDVAWEAGLDTFDVIVNATGASTDLAASGGELYRNLFATGLAVPDADGGLRVDPGTNAVLDADGRRQPRLHAIGNVTAGTFLLTSNLVLNARHARRVAGVLLPVGDPSGAAQRQAAATPLLENLHDDHRRRHV